LATAQERDRRRFGGTQAAIMKIVIGGGAIRAIALIAVSRAKRTID